MISKRTTQFLRARLILLAASFLLTQLAGCERQSHPELRGSLYFGSGQYLGRLDLRDGSTSVEANLGDVSIRQVSAFGDGNLLLTVFGPVNDTGTHRLVQYEMATGQSATLFNGRNGHYLPGMEALVYDDGSRLRVKIRAANQREEVELGRHKLHTKLQLVPVSDSVFIYSAGDDTESPIFAYDVDARATTPLEKLSLACDLNGAVWIETRQQLLCRTSASLGEVSSYVFVGLDGTFHGRFRLPELMSFQVLAHIPDQAALVLTETWRGFISDRPKTAVWIYQMDSDEAYQLVKDQYLGDSVVYRPD